MRASRRPTTRPAATPPPETIIETGEELEVDVIVTAGRKRSPAGKALFGSVSQSVILGTDRPVIDCGESPES
jgi:nucleotide-binding universal stress UspA family protein